MDVTVMAKEKLQSFIKQSLTSSQVAANTKHISPRFDNEEHQTLSEIEAEENFFNSEWSIYPPIKKKR